MPATSRVQQQSAGAALAAKRGEKPASELYGAAKEMYKDMSGTQLKHFAKTKTSGLPRRKSLIGMNTQGTTNTVGAPLAKACVNVESAARRIVDRLLNDDEAPALNEDDERAEVSSARSILAAVNRLVASLPQASPSQVHDLTIIRSSANALVRMHQTEAPEPIEPMDWSRMLQGLNPNE